MKRKTKAKTKPHASLELLGNVYLVEVDAKGKETRSEIDGKTVLDALMWVLRQSLNEAK